MSDSKKSDADVALERYITATRHEELSIEKAMIRIARSDGAIDRAEAALAKAESMAQVLHDLENDLSDLLPRVKKAAPR